MRSIKPNILCFYTTVILKLYDSKKIHNNDTMGCTQMPIYANTLTKKVYFIKCNKTYNTAMHVIHVKSLSIICSTIN